MAQRPKRETICDDPELRATSWVGPAPTGWHEPTLLLISRAPRSGKIRSVARTTGLRYNAVLPARGALLHLHGVRAASLTLGAQRVGPLPVSGGWVEAAQERGQVVLMLGTLAVPDDMAPDTYLERHGDEVVIGVLCVAGAVSGKSWCWSTTAADSAPLWHWQLATGWESQ